jgi:hypothetical protein
VSPQSHDLHFLQAKLVIAHLCALSARKVEGMCAAEQSTSLSTWAVPHFLELLATNAIEFAEDCTQPRTKRVLRLLAADLMIEAEKYRAIIKQEDAQREIDFRDRVSASVDRIHAAFLALHSPSGQDVCARLAAGLRERQFA